MSLGLLGVPTLPTLDLLGMFIFLLIGAWIGAFAVFLYQLNHSAVKSPDKASALQTQSSVWDHELYR